MRRFLLVLGLLLTGCPKSPPDLAPPADEWPVDPEFTGRVAFPQTKVVYYTLDGHSDREAYARVSKLGPRFQGHIHVAVTQWSISWVGASSPDCRPIEVLSSIQVTFPLWKPPPDAASGAVGNWQRFVRALAAHEGQHVASANEAVAALRTQMETATCTTMDTIGNTALAALRERDLAVDALTQHGALQGATLIVPPPSAPAR